MQARRNSVRIIRTFSPQSVPMRLTISSSTYTHRRVEPKRKEARPGTASHGLASGESWVRELAELHRDVAVAVVGDDPGGPDVVVGPHDVRPVAGAVHEHRVQLRVVDAAGPEADVLTALVAEPTAEVLVGPPGVRDAARVGHPERVLVGDAGEAGVPVQGSEAGAGTVL